jgi:hypothetical protein
MYDSAETFTDNQIHPKLRQAIKVKNDSLIQAMKLSDYKALKQLGSPEFVKFMHAKLKANNVIWAFRRGLLDTDKAVVFHEYYNKHGKAPNNTVLESEEDAYTFTFTNKEKETYVCMLKASFNKTDDYLITIIYGLIDGQWKLNDIEVGGFGVYGKNAQDYFAMAQKAEEDDLIIDAFMYYDTANDFLEPSGKMMKYDNAEKINLYSKHLQNKVALEYRFPHKLDNMSTAPEFISIAPVKNAKGMYPIISYRTVLPIEDTISLKREYEQVKDEAKKLYTGLNFNKDFIYYRAYQATTGENYTFEDKKK